MSNKEKERKDFRSDTIIHTAVICPLCGILDREVIIELGVCADCAQKHSREISRK